MPYFYLLILVCALDQLVKLIVIANIGPLQNIDLIPGWLSLTYVTNFGAAFGIMQSQTIILALVALGVFIFAWFNREEIKKYPLQFQMGLAIALGGALGNFIDRIRVGYVIDYIYLHFWPVFNIADIAIVGGVCLIILSFAGKELLQKSKFLNFGANSKKPSVTEEEQ